MKTVLVWLYTCLGLADAAMTFPVVRVGDDIAWDPALLTIATACSVTAILLMGAPHSYESVDRLPTRVLRAVLAIFFLRTLGELTLWGDGWFDPITKVVIGVSSANVILLALMPWARRQGMRRLLPRGMRPFDVTNIRCY